MDEKIEEFWGIIRKKYENMSDREFPGYYLSNSEVHLLLKIRIVLLIIMTNMNKKIRPSKLRI
jgi:hypothetical protein